MLTPLVKLQVARERGCVYLPEPQVYYRDPGQITLQMHSVLALLEVLTRMLHAGVFSIK